MISVCIPSFNGEKYILKQLTSILNQLGSTDEVIISDDNSSDDTLNIIYGLNDKRVKVILNTRKGLISNVENALQNAKGNFIFLADQDDIWVENKVSVVLEHLKNNDVVVSDCKVIDERETVINESFFSIVNSGKGFWKNLIKNSYLGCCMAFNRDVLNCVLPFPKRIAMHDIWIGLNASVAFKSAFIEDKLILYRRHGGNASPTAQKSNLSFTYRLIYRIIFLYEIMLRHFFRRSKR